MYEQYKVSVPAGQSGDWRIEQFTVGDEDAKFEQLRSIFNGGRGVPAGTYTRLMRGRQLVMSDTPDEIGDHLSIIHRASGHVLINGLGLGLVLQAVARKPEVESVTVIERSPDVIALVQPYYQAMFDGKIQIVNADAFDYNPPTGMRYNACWHDIWDDLCADNLPEMRTLHRKYGRQTDWQGSWGRELCERYR